MTVADLAQAPLHEVLFYDADDDVVDAVVDHVRAGLAAGEAVVVIATSPHLWAVDVALSREGVNVSIARRFGSYVALDAAETLDAFMVDGRPDAARFDRVVGGVIDDARAAGTAVRAFGEMVALLWQQGNVAGAMALEDLWNDLAERRQFSLLCAYPTTALHAAGLDDVNQVCQLHSAVLPPSSYRSTMVTGVVEVGSLVSGLFVGVPEAVAAARRLVSGALTSWGEPDLVWEGSLIISELATNAVVHGGSPFRATVERVARVVRIAVEDVGPGLPQSQRSPQDAPGGRGVAIVEHLAHRWGCDLTDGGKVFWAELDAPDGVH